MNNFFTILLGRHVIRKVFKKHFGADILRRGYKTRYGNIVSYGIVSLHHIFTNLSYDSPGHSNYLFSSLLDRNTAFHGGYHQSSLQGRRYQSSFIRPGEPKPDN